MNRDLLHESLASARAPAPIVPTAAPARPLPTAGASLSAMERGVTEYRETLKRQAASGGAGRNSYRIDGFRDGWQAAVAFLRAQETAR